MGFTRKTLSVMSLGAVDFRSDKERTAAYTRDSRKELRKQTEIMEREQAHRAVMSAPAMPPSPAAPAGWYPDPYGKATQRYFDGQIWTTQTA